MKYWLLFLCTAAVIASVVFMLTPLKKLRCEKDVCMIMEKTIYNSKPRVVHTFSKKDIKSINVEKVNNMDYIVISLKSGDDLSLKFIHTKNTAFKNRYELTQIVNKFFINIINSDKTTETEWQREVGSIQIYMYGKPVFN